MMMTPASQDSGLTDNDLYETRLKGISKVLMLVANSLNGKYANFGVMHYYKDPVLKQCLTQTLQYAMSVRFAHIINFPKVAANYFAFLEVVFRQHIELMVDICDTAKFLAVVSSLHEGLLSLHVTQVIEAAKALDALMSWYWEHQQPKYANHPAKITLERHLAQSQTLLPEVLCTLFNLVSLLNKSEWKSQARFCMILTVFCFRLSAVRVRQPREQPLGARSTSPRHPSLQPLLARVLPAASPQRSDAPCLVAAGTGGQDPSRERRPHGGSGEEHGPW
jgi:hypothetical protein